MRLLVKCSCLIAFAMFGAVPAFATMFCSEPSEPYCVDGNGYFDDESQFNSCKSEVEDYLSDVKTYTQCLTDESNDAVRKSNDIVEKFNCRAAGKSYC